MEGLFPGPYGGLAQQLFGAQPETVTLEADVAQAVSRRNSNKLRFPAGPDAVALARNARDGLFLKLDPPARFDLGPR